jgi:hypothetical protein
MLLFVSAHWEEPALSSRFTMVTLMVAVFHAGGAFATRRTEALSITLHGIGTALGAGRLNGGGHEGVTPTADPELGLSMTLTTA